MRRLSRTLILVWAWSIGPGVATATGPADGLFRLVPPDAGVTLAVEDLRTHFRAIAAEPLPEKIRRLAGVQAWLGSEKARPFERAAKDIQAALGEPIGVLRDDLIGDAVVLTFMPGPTNAPDQARGLLLARPRDQALLLRLVATMNAAQAKGGELLGVDKKERRGAAYMVRNFKPGGRLTEFYAHLDDGSFAWSNSEALIQGVIDRKLDRLPCLKDNPAFLKVRQGLPERALASLYVNPRLIERAMADSPRVPKPEQERPLAMLGRYLGAVGYMGLALEWRDGPVVHMREAIDPAKLDPWLKAWLTDPTPPAAGLLPRVPISALAVVAGHVDFEAIRDLLWELTPEDDRPALDNWKAVFQGLLLGADPNTEVLPRLSPGALLYIDSRPESDSRPLFPMVGVVGWTDPPGSGDLSAPIDNALRTGLAGYALDPRHKAKHLRVVSRTVGEVPLTTLTDGLGTQFAYTVTRSRIVAGTGAEAVARFGSNNFRSTFPEVRDRYFPGVETFAIVDLLRLAQEIRHYRGPIARLLAARSRRPAVEVDRDLGQLLGVIDLFRAASFTTVAEEDTTAIQRTARLIAR